MKEMFTIHVQFIGNKFDGVDKRGRMTETHDEASLMDAVQRLTQGPAAQLGLIEEVKVVDMLDCTNFLWQKGKLVFPVKGVHF
jgi:tRNA G37 N-methylase TrmD